MRELIEQVLDEIKGAWRFRWVAVLIAWIVCVLGWAVVMVLPNKYEASARVFVDPSTALKPVIQGIAVEQDVTAQLNLVRQSMLSDAQLQHVLTETTLGVGIYTPQQRATVINSLRDRIWLEVQGTSPPGTDPYNMNPSKIYSITYRDSDRERGLKVVSILLNSFMEGTLGGKRQASLAAQRFLEEQIKDYEQRLGEAEDRLADFKKRNIGMVPGEQQSDYFTTLQNEMDAVKKAEGQLSLAMTRRDALARQLRGETPIAASAVGPTVTATGAPQSGGDTLSRIKETQAKLDDLLLRFTDKHPDVIATRQTLQDLKDRRAAELEALRQGDPNAAALTGASANPVFQSIQLSMNQTDVEIAGLRGELAAHQQKVSDLRKLLDTMPQVEAEYARLNRDYSVTKAQYTALAERLEKARVGEEADATGSVRFEVIDPPSASFKPVAPRRPLFFAAILVVAIALGLGVAYLLNLLRPVFVSVRSLKKVTGVTVLGAISVSRSPVELSARRRSALLYCGAVGALLVLFVAVVLVGRQFAPLGASLFASL